MLSRLYKMFYGRWGRPSASARPGYTLWLFMPGDLPFFFDIFLGVFAGKRTEHLVETVVVPDLSTPELRARFEAFRSAWPHGEVRMVDFRPLDRWLTRAMHNPHTINWLQLVNAVNEARSTHGLWHDADLFVLDPDFFDAHYRECSGRGLDCLGLAPVWDGWYAEVGLPHVTATWEMIFRVDWLRQFAPWMHRGHDGPLKGEVHMFDSTLLPQALTPPEKVGRRGEAPDFIHFNYVICTYRNFQNSKGSFEDEHFRILLIRLLIDAFDSGGWAYDAPPVDDLVPGLTDPSRRVTYTSPKAAANFDEFRTKLQRLIESPILTPAQASKIAEGVERFDLAFRWSPAKAAHAVP